MLKRIYRTSRKFAAHFVNVYKKIESVSKDYEYDYKYEVRPFGAKTLLLERSSST